MSRAKVSGDLTIQNAFTSVAHDSINICAEICRRTVREVFAWEIDTRNSNVAIPANTAVTNKTCNKAAPFLDKSIYILPNLPHFRGVRHRAK